MSWIFLSKNDGHKLIKPPTSSSFSSKSLKSILISSRYVWWILLKFRNSCHKCVYGWIDINNLWTVKPCLYQHNTFFYRSQTLHFILLYTPRIKSKCPFRINKKSIFTYRHYFSVFFVMYLIRTCYLYVMKIFITFLFRVLITFSSRGCDSNKYSTGIVWFFLLESI